MITKENLQKAKEMYEEVFGYDPKHGSLSAVSTIAIVMLAKEIDTNGQLPQGADRSGLVAQTTT